MSRIYAILVALVLSAFLFSCGGSDREILETTLTEYKITLDYDRLTMPDADPIAGTRPGGVWNFGATDRPALFTTEGTNLMFGAGYILAGRFSLWAQRGLEDHWYFVFNKGVESGTYDQSLDVAVIPVRYSRLETPVERLTITLSTQGEEGQFVVRWGNHQFDTGFSLPPMR